MVWTPEWTFASVVNTPSGNGYEWTAGTLDNVLTVDNDAALCEDTTTSISDYLSLTSALGMIIPAGSTLHNARIKFRIRRSPTQSGRYSRGFVRMGTSTVIEKQVQFENEASPTFEGDLAYWGVTEQQLQDIIDGTDPVLAYGGDSNQSGVDLRMYWVTLAVDYTSPQTEVLSPPVVL